MKKKPLVSVIINCLNGAKYLDKAIRSVVDQNYKNWEIIFFDNNSTDQSCLLLKRYKDTRIKYFKSKKTHTLYKARNLAIKKSKGQLISFLDVDDWWVKSKLNKQVKFFLKDKSIDVIYSNVYLYYEKDKTKKIYIKKKLNEGKLTQKLINKFEIPILSTVIKRNIFDKIKFDTRFTIIGDFDFFVRLSLTKHIFAVQEPLAYYRVHDSNLSKKKIDLNINELETWLSEKKKEKKFNKINFSKLNNFIEVLKVQKNFIEKNVLKLILGVIRNFFKILSVKF